MENGPKFSKKAITRLQRPIETNSFRPLLVSLRPTCGSNTSSNGGYHPGYFLRQLFSNFRVDFIESIILIDSLFPFFCIKPFNIICSYLNIIQQLQIHFYYRFISNIKKKLIYLFNQIMTLF
jgi:hypothetical protein